MKEVENYKNELIRQILEYNKFLIEKNVELTNQLKEKNEQISFYNSKNEENNNINSLMFKDNMKLKNIIIKLIQNSNKNNLQELLLTKEEKEIIEEMYFLENIITKHNENIKSQINEIIENNSIEEKNQKSSIKTNKNSKEITKQKMFEYKNNYLLTKNTKNQKQLDIALIKIIQQVLDSDIEKEYLKLSIEKLKKIINLTSKHKTLENHKEFLKTILQIKLEN